MVAARLEPGGSAKGVLRVHPIRTADAVQLAAAFIAAERRPSSLEVVTLDDRLAGAARKDGFVLIDVPSSERVAPRTRGTVLALSRASLPPRPSPEGRRARIQRPGPVDRRT